MNNIKQISIDQLKVGMFIAEGNDQWVPESNMTRKGLVNRPEVIENIKALGVKSLYIDISKGKDCSPPSLDTHLALTPTVAFKKELENAALIKNKAAILIEHCMQGLKNDQHVDIAPLSEVTHDLIDSLSNNYNALSCVTQMRQKDRYLMEHSFNVSVLMGVLAMSLGINGDRLHELVTGAILHDIGKIRIPDSILHKPGKLTPDEWEEMKRHVEYGENILKGRSGITQAMVEICAQHHERLNGQGYPRGLKATQMDLHARMAGIVDVYDAITADRVYHKGMAPTAALKKMLTWDDELDKELLYQFIKAMGVYPAGTVVELSNHKLAIVLEANLQEKNKPKVLQVYDVRTRRYDNKHVIDLADERCPHHIVKSVCADSFGIKIGDFIKS